MERYASFIAALGRYIRAGGLTARFEVDPDTLERETGFAADNWPNPTPELSPFVVFDLLGRPPDVEPRFLADFEARAAPVTVRSDLTIDDVLGAVASEVVARIAANQEFSVAGLGAALGVLPGHVRRAIEEFRGDFGDRVLVSSGDYYNWRETETVEALNTVVNPLAKRAKPAVRDATSEEDEVLMADTQFFISHSSGDRELVELLLDLLVEGVGVERRRIFCTSVRGHGPPPGSKFIDEIKSKVTANSIVLPVVSTNFMQSLFSWTEVGAAWALDAELKPSMAPGCDFELVKDTVLWGIQGTRLEDPGDLGLLRDELCKLKGVAATPTAQWDRKRDLFLDGLPATATATRPTPSGASDTPARDDDVDVSLESFTGNVNTVFDVVDGAFGHGQVAALSDTLSGFAMKCPMHLLRLYCDALSAYAHAGEHAVDSRDPLVRACSLAVGRMNRGERVAWLVDMGNEFTLRAWLFLSESQLRDEIQRVPGAAPKVRDALKRRFMKRGLRGTDLRSVYQWWREVAPTSDRRAWAKHHFDQVANEQEQARAIPLFFKSGPAGLVVDADEVRSLGVRALLDDSLNRLAKSAFGAGVYPYREAFHAVDWEDEGL